MNQFDIAEFITELGEEDSVKMATVFRLLSKERGAEVFAELDAPEQQEIINSITKRLCPSVAAAFNTTPSKVERAIRHAIEVAWNRGKIENINNIFGMKIYSANEKPTNGEFIALVADKMLLEGA